MSIEPERVTMRTRVWHDSRSGTAVSSGVVQAIARRLAARSVDATVVTPPPATALTPPATR